MMASSEVLRSPMFVSDPWTNALWISTEQTISIPSNFPLRRGNKLWDKERSKLFILMLVRHDGILSHVLRGRRAVWQVQNHVCIYAYIKSRKGVINYLFSKWKGKGESCAGSWFGFGTVASVLNSPEWQCHLFGKGTMLARASNAKKIKVTLRRITQPAESSLKANPKIFKIQCKYSFKWQAQGFVFGQG